MCSAHPLSTLQDLIARLTLYTTPESVDVLPEGYETAQEEESVQRVTMEAPKGEGWRKAQVESLYCNTLSL